MPHEWFAQRLLLTLSGQRPMIWMLGHTKGQAYDQLLELAPLTPLRSSARRPAITKCHWSQPAPGIIEASARVAYGERLRAMAFRLERGEDARWRCTAVEVGPRT